MAHPTYRAVVLALCALAGCASPEPPGATGAVAPTVHTLPIVAWFDEYDEVFEGTATQILPLRGAALDISSHVREERCIGFSEPRILPPSADPPRRCDGMRGEARLTCTDGRLLTIEWWSEETCGTGYGKGADQQGRTLHLAFGGSDVRARTIADEALAAQSEHPPLPPLAPVPGAGAGASSAPSVGTGFFVTWQGHILTNNHVVKGRDHIQIKIDDGDLLDAYLVRSDEENDLALLHAEAIRTPLPLRPDAKLVKGSQVFTLGYPLVQLQGPEQKATFGRINALSGLQGDDRFAQIDVPIQPGNSGGPLLNTRGEVVGVVSAMLAPSATMQIAGTLPQNVNYALKSPFALELLEKNLSGGWPPPLASAPDREFGELVAMVEDSVVLVVAE